MIKIPFNRPFIVGRELFYIAQAVIRGQIAADGFYTKQCSSFLERQYAVGRALMTPSCTASLEMAAILGNLEQGDEVIMPSYTFVSTASAIHRAGARPVFVDIRSDTLNLDETLIEQAITPKTKMIVPVHYAGVACEMDTIMDIARKSNLLVVEDAAQGVNATYKGRALGSIGQMGAYSFHETKNYICGEGGALCVNSPELVERAEIVRDKGTDRQKFYRGQVDKYSWVDIGSSYVPSELTCAFLWAQLEHAQEISDRRAAVYANYSSGFEEAESSELLRRPVIPEDCGSNSHMYYILLPTRSVRDSLMDHLKTLGIETVFHYVPLHSSPMGKRLSGECQRLPITEELSGKLLRLPFFYDITREEVDLVVTEVVHYLRSH